MRWPNLLSFFAMWVVLAPAVSANGVQASVSSTTVENESGTVKVLSATLVTLIRDVDGKPVRSSFVVNKQTLIAAKAGQWAIVRFETKGKKRIAVSIALPASRKLQPALKPGGVGVVAGVHPNIAVPPSSRVTGIGGTCTTCMALGNKSAVSHGTLSSHVDTAGNGKVIRSPGTADKTQTVARVDDKFTTRSYGDFASVWSGGRHVYSVSIGKADGSRIVVARGMTEEELIKNLGEPTTREISPQAGSETVAPTVTFLYPTLRVDLQQAVVTGIEVESAQDNSLGSVAGTASNVTDGGHAAIAPGMTLEEVTKLLGQPAETLDLAGEQIYVYKDLKIIFEDGKVKKVE